ncbi:MAG: hypothetical protein IPK64_19595 [bacterium]|nr:hypothetical protein [bacterium]
MTNTRTLQQSFAGGEISEDMYSRVEDGKYRSGAARLRNFIVRPTGTVASRPGFQYVGTTKYGTSIARLHKFTVSPTLTLLLEMGEGYFRFYQDGARVELSTTPPTYIPNRTFVEGDVDVGTNELTIPSHGVVTGTSITFTADNGGTLPAPLVALTEYFAIQVSATVIKVAETFALALVGTAIDITDDGDTSGSKRHRFQGYYAPMDLVKYDAGAGLVNYYCATNPSVNGVAQQVPGSAPAYWLALEDDIYEIPHPYTNDELFSLTFSQSNDVLSIASNAHPIGELRRYGELEWQYVAVTFGASIEPPTVTLDTALPGIYHVITAAVGGVMTTYAQHRLGVGDVIRLSGMLATTPSGAFVADGNYMVAAVPTLTTFEAVVLYGAGALATSGTYTANSGTVQYIGTIEDATETYVATAVGTNGIESEQSVSLDVLNNLRAREARNTLTLTPGDATPLDRLNVYKETNGLYGYIGQVDANVATEFIDDNIGPDLGSTPPLLDDSLAGGYPAAVAHFEQRRWVANTADGPQQVWASRIGTESDMVYHIPVQSTDRISFSIASRQRAEIRHIVPLQQLLLMTDTGEYRVTPVNSDAITPTTIAVRAQSYVGCTSVSPIIVNSTLLFCAARGGHVREMGFSAQVDSYVTGDLSIRASHLFDGHEIIDSTFSKSPYPIAWFTSDDGRLLGLTYIPEENVGAWHWHDTDGLFQSVCSIPEGLEDRLYVVVARNLGGVATTTIERMGAQATPATLDDSFCVDCGLTYDSTAATTITELSHLNAEAVSVLADGLVVTGKTVSGGSITLSTAASVVHVGLPFTCDLQTMPLAVQIEAAGHGRTKNVNRVWMRCVDSGTFDVGPNSTLLRSSDPRGDNAGEFVTGQVMVPIDGRWTDDGQVWLRQSAPLPVTVVGQVLEVSIGG